PPQATYPRQFPICSRAFPSPPLSPSSLFPRRGASLSLDLDPPCRAVDAPRSGTPGADRHSHRLACQPAGTLLEDQYGVALGSRDGGRAEGSFSRISRLSPFSTWGLDDARGR